MSNWQPAPIVHPLRGGGRVLKIDLDDPRDRPIHMAFDTGEVHHYSLASAAAKLEQVESKTVSEDRAETRSLT